LKFLIWKIFLVPFAIISFSSQLYAENDPAGSHVVSVRSSFFKQLAQQSAPQFPSVSPPVDLKSHSQPAKQVSSGPQNPQVLQGALLQLQNQSPQSAFLSQAQPQSAYSFLSELQKTGISKGHASLNFDDADIYEVAQAIFGAILKFNYIMDPRVKGHVKIVFRRHYRGRFYSCINRLP